MASNYTAIANTYYKYKVRVLCAVDFFKGKVLEQIDNEHIATYKTMLHNVEVAYHNLTKVKAELNLPLHDFSSFQGDGFIIHRGRIYGDIAKAKEYAIGLIGVNQSDSEKDPECNRLFELGLFISHYGEKIKKDYVAIPDFLQTAEKSENIADNSVLSKGNGKANEETPIKADSDTSAGKNSGSSSIFSIFAQINKPTMALG